MSKNQKNTFKKPDLAPQEYDRKWDQERMYKRIKKLNDPRFGEITVVKNPSTNRVLMVKERMFTSKAAATTEIYELKSRMKLNHPNTLKMENYTTAVKKELCSTNYITKAFYEFPRTDMFKEKSSRKNVMTSFNDRELTHMAYQGLNGLDHLHSNGEAHGDVRPSLVGWDKNINQYSILDRLGDPTQIEKCQTNNLINNKDLYMSPQVYAKVKGKDKKFQFDPYKNDVHALGMSLLNIGTMENVKDCYLQNGEMHWNRLDEHIAEFEGKYRENNPVLCHAVRRMIAMNENERPDAKELLNELPSYDEFKRVEANGQPFLAGGRFNLPSETRVEVENQPEEVTQPVEANQEIELENMNNDYFGNNTSQPKVQNAPPMDFQNQTNTSQNQPQPVPQQQQYYQRPSQQPQYQNIQYDNNQNPQVYANQSNPQYLYSNIQQPPVYYQNQPNMPYVKQSVGNEGNPNSTFDETNSNVRYVRSYNDPNHSNYTQSQSNITPPPYVYGQQVTYIQGDQGFRPSQTQVQYVQPQTQYVQPSYVYTQPQVVYRPQSPGYISNPSQQQVNVQMPSDKQSDLRPNSPSFIPNEQPQEQAFHRPSSPNLVQNQPERTYVRQSSPNTYQNQVPPQQIYYAQQQPTYIQYQQPEVVYYRPNSPNYIQTQNVQPQAQQYVNYIPAQQEPTRVIRYSRNDVRTSQPRTERKSQTKVIRVSQQRMDGKVIRVSQNRVEGQVIRKSAEGQVLEQRKSITFQNTDKFGPGSNREVVVQKEEPKEYFQPAHVEIRQGTPEQPEEENDDRKIARIKYVMQQDGTIVQVNTYEDHP